jgi:hypothetical protein
MCQGVALSLTVARSCFAHGRLCGECGSSRTGGVFWTRWDGGCLRSARGVWCRRAPGHPGHPGAGWNPGAGAFGAAWRQWRARCAGLAWHPCATRHGRSPRLEWGTRYAGLQRHERRAGQGWCAWTKRAQRRLQLRLPPPLWPLPLLGTCQLRPRRGRRSGSGGELGKDALRRRCRSAEASRSAEGSRSAEASKAVPVPLRSHSGPILKKLKDQNLGEVKVWKAARRLMVLCVTSKPPAS